MKNKVCSLFLIAMMLMSDAVPVVNAQIFDDVSENQEAYESIGLLSNLGIIEGVGNNMFLPENDVSRADFVIMLSKLLEIRSTGNASFSDVTPEDYFYDCVMNAANAGIVSGYGDGIFAPGKSITMQEAVKIAISAYEKINGITMQISQNSIVEKADVWAKSVCDKAATANIIDEGFIPDKNLTRSEAAQMLAGLLLYSEEMTEGDYERETYVVQKQRGNIFTDCDPTPEIEVRTGYPVIETIATDFWGNAVVHRYDKTLNGSVCFKFDDLDFGHYYIDIYGRDDEGNRKLLTDTTVSYIKKFEASSPDENPFGVNFHSTRSSSGWQADLLYEASLIGARHVRDEWYWSQVEKEKGVYTNFLQELSDNCIKYGIGLHPVCAFYSPFYDDGMRPYTDEGRTGYANVANAFYDILPDRDLFKRVEMYNEWWNPNTVKGSPAGYQDLSYLNALHEKTQEIVKQNHPDAILTSMSHHKNNVYSHNFFESGCINSIDELTVHFYPAMDNASEVTASGARPEGNPEKQVDEQYKFWSEMTKEYSGKELGKTLKWGCTETGYAVDYINQTEHYQATFYPRLFVAFLHYNPEYVNAYDFLCDGNNELNKENNFGLINAQNSKHGSYTGRPSYVAYGVTARMIDNKDGISKENRDNIYHYTFEKDNDIIHTFNTEYYDNTMIAIQADKTLVVTDCMGESRDFVPVDGKIYLTLSEDIVYVQGDIKSWEVVNNVEFEEVGNSVLGTEIFLKTKSDNLGIDNLSYEILGTDYNYDEIVAPASYDKDERVIKIFAKLNGQYVAQFNKVVTIDDKYTLNAEFDVKKTDEGVVPFVKMIIESNSNEDMMINSVRYTVNGESFEEAVEKTLYGNDKIEIELNSDIFEMYRPYEMVFRVISDGMISNYVDAEKSDIFAPLQKKTMVIDGKIDEDVKALSVTDFNSMYNLWQTGELLWTGKDDFSGNGWVSYDEENLYLAYRIIDDVHLQNNALTRTWAQDCIQVGFYHEEYEKYDIEYDATQVMPNLYWICDFSLNSSTGEKQMYKSKVLQVDEDPYVWEGVEYEIKRYEKEKATVYEIAIPWKTLLLDVNELSHYQIEVAVQDADEGERSNAYYLTGDAIHLTKNRYNFLKHIIIE